MGSKAGQDDDDDDEEESEEEEEDADEEEMPSHTLMHESMVRPYEKPSLTLGWNHKKHKARESRRQRPEDSLTSLWEQQVTRRIE